MSDRLIGDLNPTVDHLFNTPKAKGEGVIQPDAVEDNLRWEAMSFITDAHSLSFT